MLNVALLDCAINENHCNEDWGRGICPRFSSPSRSIWQLKCPSPQKFTIQGKNGFDGCIMQKFRYFFLQNVQNFLPFLQSYSTKTTKLSLNLTN